MLKRRIESFKTISEAYEWKTWNSVICISSFNALLYCRESCLYLIYIYIFVRSLPFSVSNVDLSIACKSGGPHHISSCSGGKEIDYLFCLTIF